MHMNKALTKCFLSIFAYEHQRGYNATIVSDPNRTFGHTFSHFYRQFGIRDKAEIEQNRDNMRKPWNIPDGWEVLKDRFDDGIAYAIFIDAQINATDALNMLIYVMLQYEEWHALPRSDCTLTNAWVWWGMKTRPKRKIGAVPGEMGCGQHYGGNTADQIQHQPEGDAQYEAIIEEFARGNSRTQQTISNQQTQIQQQSMAMSEMQQQLEMSAAQLWHQRQQQPPHQHQYNTRDKKGPQRPL